MPILHTKSLGEKSCVMSFATSIGIEVGSIIGGEKLQFLLGVNTEWRYTIQCHVIDGQFSFS